MNRKVLILTIISILSLTLVSGIIYVAVSRTIHSDAKTTDSSDTAGNDLSPTVSPDDIKEVTLTPQEQEQTEKEIKDFVPATKMDLDPSSITVFVNKEHSLPKTYKPDELVRPDVNFNATYSEEKSLMRPEAAKALEKLFAAAEKSGYKLTGVSAYRSYSRQYQIFRNNIKTQGKTHTLMYSAVPGTSEHQTGLSIDISAGSNSNRLNDDFASTPEGMWVAKNAHLFGFIVRYPKDKASITGYAYEPWHIRYVGKGLAYYMFKNDLSLEEYYHYTPDPNFDFETVYASIINYTPPTYHRPATPTPALTISISPTLTIAPNDGGDIDITNTPSKAPLTPTPKPTHTPTPKVTKAPTHTPIPTKAPTAPTSPVVNTSGSIDSVTE